MDWTAVVVVPTLFVGLPWLILHYMTQWRRNQGLTIQDEKLLDDLYETARKLDDRVQTIERIMTADNPRWREERIAAPQTVRELDFDRRH
ncbi:MAG: envelope stress response membrane protein PspB [Sphingomonadaceae bacterium]|nr:envelope stress response membrane protein PspB [Sphingomonadaceae bacterium]